MGWEALGTWSRRQRAAVAATVVLLALIGVGVVVLRPQPTPFPLARMQARATFTVTDSAHVQAIADRLTGGHRLPALVAIPRQQIVGQLHFATVGSTSDEGELALFVIDNRAARPLGIMSGVGPGGADVAAGWEGDYQRLARKYAWLRPLAEIHVDGGYQDPGESLSFRPALRGPVTFTAALDPGALPLTRPTRDLGFVLAYVGRDGVWAERVPASPTA
jgi:hypothetical protein